MLLMDCVANDSKRIKNSYQLRVLSVVLLPDIYVLSTHHTKYKLSLPLLALHQTASLKAVVIEPVDYVQYACSPSQRDSKLRSEYWPEWRSILNQSFRLGRGRYVGREIRRNVGVSTMWKLARLDIYWSKCIYLEKATAALNQLSKPSYGSMYPIQTAVPIQSKSMPITYVQPDAHATSSPGSSMEIK